MRDKFVVEKLKLTKYGLYALILFIMYSTDSALVSTNSNRIWARVAWICLLFCAAYIVPKAKLTLSNIRYLFFFSIGILLSMVVNEGFDVNFIQRIVLLWLALSISRIIDYDLLMEYYIKIIKFIAVFSMICYLLSPVLLQLPLLRLNVNGGDYLINMIFTTINPIIDRNYGPFWEPGAFQLYINWAVLYQVKNPAHFKSKDIILFALCIFTTKSTAGFMIFGLIMLYYAYIKLTTRGRGNSVFQVFFIFAFLALIVGAVVTSEELSNVIFGKIAAMSENPDEINSANISTYTRIYSVPASLDVMKDHPLFGVGVDQLQIEVMRRYDITSNTASILSMFASFGLIPGVLYALLFFKAAFKKGQPFILNFLFFFILVAMYSTENLIASLMFYTVLFYESKRYSPQLNTLV